MFDHILLSAFSQRACRNDAMAHPATCRTGICYTRNPLHDRVIFYPSLEEDSIASTLKGDLPAS